VSSLQGLASLHARDILAGGGPTMSGEAITKVALEFLGLHEFGFVLDAHVGLHGNAQAPDALFSLEQGRESVTPLLIEPPLNKKSKRTPA
jgi:hypothetical protein